MYYAVMSNNPLPFRECPIDIFFIVRFALFIVTSGIVDLIPTLGIDTSPDSPNFLARANYGYAYETDLLFLYTVERPFDRKF